MTLKVLIADEDPMLLEAFAYILRKANFLVCTATDGIGALQQLRAERPHMVILSASLRNASETEVCCALRKDITYPFLGPILMWGSNTSEDSRIAALECGATDYLIKPFGLREFMARIEALLGGRRRSRGGSRHASSGAYPGDEALEFSGIHLDPASREVYVEVDGERREVHLALKEFNLLHFLMAHHGEVVTRTTLIEHLWGERVPDGSPDRKLVKTLDTHIHHLRMKVEQNPSQPEFILTVYNQGFRFKVQAKPK